MNECDLERGQSGQGGFDENVWEVDSRNCRMASRQVALQAIQCRQSIP